ncbi:hypothetical protein [Corynebacterium sp.]|uniref:hypothetical protein n=1 Tax=Corynebacterium sp. TaxID=1720 RepID=UPI003B3A7F06
MNPITAPGWHYGTVHAFPTSPAAARSTGTAPAAAPGRRPSGRRLLAVGAALCVTAGTLTACSTEPPRPDESLESLVHQLDALDGTPAADGTAIFADQARAVSAEIVRQCGTDRDGNPPQDCGAPAPGELTEAPSVDEVRTQMRDLIDGADTGGDAAPDEDGQRDRAVLLTGLHAALATLDDRSAGGSAIDQDLIDAGYGGDPAVSAQTAEALAPVTDLVDQAVFLSGVVLPVAGADGATVTTVGDRMRTVRDAVAPASGVAAEAGYRMPEGVSAPTDAASAATVLLEAVHAVTVSLRRAVDDVSADDRTLTAVLCAVAARSEAALEDAVGDDPLDVSIRGE